MAWVTTFYSFKGGVGRSLALANTAWVLARDGYRVVVVDMDMEAPSLDRFATLLPQGADEGEGVLELARAYARDGEVPAVAPLLRACSDIPGGGELRVLPAGRRDGAYADDLAALRWRHLHPERGTQPFLDGLLAGLDAVKPDYVLVDSRTGLSDVGGLTTHRMADQVVLVFNLTSACLEGTVRAYRSMAVEPRVKDFVLVASPVPQTGEPLVEERVRWAAREMPRGAGTRRGVIRVDYDARMVLSEALAVEQPERFAAAVRYEELRTRVQRANPGDVFAVAERAQEADRLGRGAEGDGMLEAFVAAHPESRQGWAMLGLRATAHERWQQAEAALRRALELGLERGEVVGNLGHVLGSRADGGDAEATALHREALTMFDRAVELAPDVPWWSTNRATALQRLSWEQEGEARVDAMAVARAAFEQALSRHPDFQPAVLGLAGCLLQQAQLVEEQARGPLLEQAHHRYLAARQLGPVPALTLANHGLTALLLAARAEPSQRTGLLERALADLQEAAHQGIPGSYNLACALSLLGRLDDAAPHLRAALDTGEVTLDHARADPDLAPLRDACPELFDAD